MQITIASTTIRRDSEGRYCLNNLHRASGNDHKHQPYYFFDRKEKMELRAALSHEPGFNPGIPVVMIHKGQGRGAYVVKELAYAYAM